MRHWGSAAKSCALSFLRKQKIGHAMTRNSAMRIFPFWRARSLFIRRELLRRCYSTPDHPAHFHSPN
jgi:hypothetical protein